MSKKTGEEKIADAAKAADKLQGVSGADASAALPDILAGAAAEAKANGATPEQVERIEKLLNQLTGIVEKQNSRLVSLETKTPAIETAAPLKNAVCPTCLQGIKCCKGDHVTIRVLPQNAMNIKAFGGIGRNGVNYFGRCIVPRVLAEEILAAVNHYEQDEMRLETNHGKMLDLSKRLASLDSARATEVVTLK